MIEPEDTAPLHEPAAEAADVPAEPMVQVAAPESLEPVSSGERMEIVDILRGVALLGILFVNMKFYTAPLRIFWTPELYWPEPHNVWASWLILFFAQGKFYTLFSFLFGLGISIQLLRAQERGRGFLGYHYRRMLVLLVFGLLHAFGIWMGDILVTYAVLGCILPLFLNRQPATLLIWAVIILVLLVMVFAVMAGLSALGRLGYVPTPSDIDTYVNQERSAADEEARIYGQESYAEITKLRKAQTLDAWYFVLIEQGPHSFAMFLLGLYVGKRRWFDNLPASLPWFWRGWLLGLVLGLGGGVLTHFCFSHVNIANSFSQAWILAGSAIGFITAPALSCFYACSLVLLYQSNFFRRLLSPISAVGQMALTNYLAQSLICSTMFYGSTFLFGLGFGYYARIGPAAGLGLTVLIWFLEVVWSVLWLRVLEFRFGPMEWLWRTLSYGRLQPLR